MSKLPSILSTQRATIVSHGMMQSVVPSGVLPIPVVRHGIRGVTSKADAKTPANIQRTESAHTHPNASGLRVMFTFNTIAANANLITGCSEAAYRADLVDFIARHFREDCPEFVEVTRRMARNILNGRWLWRNRILGAVKITALVAGGRADGMVFSGEGSKLSSFADYTADEKAFARDVIAAGLLRGEDCAVEVQADIGFRFARAIEVFPSQNMVTSKPEGFGRSLFKLEALSRREFGSILQTADRGGKDAGEFSADMIDMGDAALRDQKIGNAIRCIDTWYPEHVKANKEDPSFFAPIPIEPNGANLEANRFLRGAGSDARTLLKDIRARKRHNSDATDGEIAYLIGLLIRGGVFSEGEEKKGGDK